MVLSLEELAQIGPRLHLELQLLIFEHIAPPEFVMVVSWVGLLSFQCKGHYPFRLHFDDVLFCFYRQGVTAVQEEDCQYSLVDIEAPSPEPYTLLAISFLLQ